MQLNSAEDRAMLGSNSNADRVAETEGSGFDNQSRSPFSSLRGQHESEKSNQKLHEHVTV
jgi:hypothetical protein